MHENVGLDIVTGKKLRFLFDILVVPAFGDLN